MAVNIILICLTAISALNALLIWDLYNRSARMAEMANTVHHIATSMKHSVERIAANLGE